MLCPHALLSPLRTSCPESSLGGHSPLIVLLSLKLHECGVSSHTQINFIDKWVFQTPQWIFFFFKFLAVLGLCRCAGCSLAAPSGGYTPAAVGWLLIAVASLLVECGL